MANVACADEYNFVSNMISHGSHCAIIDIDEKKLAGNVMDLNHGVVWAPDWATEKKAHGGEIKPCHGGAHCGVLPRNTAFALLLPTATFEG